jgi:hypothetical protein
MRDEIPMVDPNQADEPRAAPSGMRSATRDWRWVWLIVPILVILGLILWIVT